MIELAPEDVNVISIVERYVPHDVLIAAETKDAR